MLFNFGQVIFPFWSLGFPFCKMRGLNGRLQKGPIWALAGSFHTAALFTGFLLALQNIQSVQLSGVAAVPIKAHFASLLLPSCLCAPLPVIKENKGKWNQLPSEYWPKCEGYYKCAI